MVKTFIYLFLGIGFVITLVNSTTQDNTNQATNSTSNQTKIKEAVTKIELTKEQKQEKINELLEKVKKIPASKYHENKIFYAKLMALDPENKLYKDKYSHYTKLQKSAYEKKKKNAIKNMKKNHDDMKNITWYQDKTAPRYSNQNGFYLYFSKNNLRLKIQYHADNWLFIKNVLIKTDNNTYEIKNYFKRDNQGGKIWEWTDLYVGDKLPMINDIANSKKIKIRLEGSKYHKDKILTKKQKRAFTNTLTAYLAISK